MIIEVYNTLHKVQGGKVYYFHEGEWYRSTKNLTDLADHWYRQASASSARVKQELQAKYRIAARALVKSGEWVNVRPEDVAV